MRTKSILVVEDDPGIRETLQCALEMEGYEVATAENGQKALACLPKIGSPGLILLDLMMPVMNGWQFLEEMRKSKKLSKIPVVVVTAGSDPSRALPDRKVLRKPFDLDQVLKLVHCYCDQAA